MPDTGSLYFFALRTDKGVEIDSVGRDLDDSSAYEQVDVASGLIAWDELGTSYRFEPRRDHEGTGWMVEKTGGDDSARLTEALRGLLLNVMQSRRHGRRAQSIGIDADAVRAATLPELVLFVRRMDLEDEY